MKRAIKTKVLDTGQIEVFLGGILCAILSYGELEDLRTALFDAQLASEALERRLHVERLDRARDLVKASQDVPEALLTERLTTEFGLTPSRARKLIATHRPKPPRST